MADVIVSGGEDQNEPQTAEQMAVAAAAAEGATAVHASQAEQAAAEAQLAAEQAQAAALANLEATSDAIASGESAQAAARDAAVSAEMIHEALLGMKSSVDVLIEELRASRKATFPEEKPRRRSDREPSSGTQVRVRR